MRHRRQQPILLTKLALSSIDFDAKSLHSANLCVPLHNEHVALFGLGDVSVAGVTDLPVEAGAVAGTVVEIEVVNIVGDGRVSLLDAPGQPCLRSPLGFDECF